MDAVEVKLHSVLTSVLTGQCCAAVMKISFVPVIGNGEGKAHPRTDHQDPEREKRYCCTFPLTWALDGVVVNTTPRALYPREREPVAIVQEAG